MLASLLCAAFSYRRESSMQKADRMGANNLPSVHSSWRLVVVTGKLNLEVSEFPTRPWHLDWRWSTHQQDKFWCFHWMESLNKFLLNAVKGILHGGSGANARFGAFQCFIFIFWLESLPILYRNKKPQWCIVVSRQTSRFLILVTYLFLIKN